MLVAQGAKVLHPFVRERAGAPLALDRLDQDGRRGRARRRSLDRLPVPPGDMDVAGQLRTEPGHIAGVAGGVHRRVGSAMEGAVEADDVDPFWLAIGRMVFAGGLQRAFDRLGPGVGEEADVSETDLAQALGQRLLVRNPIEVGNVPELLALRLEGLDQGGMRVAERVHCDAGHAVEIGLAFGGVEAHAAASLERQRGAAVDAHQMVGGDGDLLRSGFRSRHVQPSKRETPRLPRLGVRSGPERKRGF